MKIIVVVLMLSVMVALGCNAKDSSQEVNSSENNNKTETTDTIQPESNYELGAWITNFDQAKKYAKDLNRPILINFTGSDWCSWCIKLKKEVFSQDAFMDYAKENLVLLMIDFPKKKPLPKTEEQLNNALASEFGIEGFPTIALANSSGEEINRTGYQAGGADNYITHLKDLLKVSPK